MTTEPTTFSEISKEDRMRIYDYRERNKCDYNEVRELFPHYNLNDFCINQCLSYGIQQILHFSGYKTQKIDFYTGKPNYATNQQFKTVITDNWKD